MYSVIVRDTQTGRELARYTYLTLQQAQETKRDVAAVRRQNRERVKVTVEKDNEHQGDVR